MVFWSVRYLHISYYFPIYSFLNSTTDDMPIDEFWHPRYEEFLDIMFEKPADENVIAVVSVM